MNLAQMTPISVSEFGNVLNCRVPNSRIPDCPYRIMVYRIVVLPIDD